MGGPVNILRDAVKQGHAAAVEQAKAEMPSLELNEIIKMVLDVFSAENKLEASINAAKILSEKYQKPIEIYINAFAVKFVEDSLKAVKVAEFSSLGNEEFADKVVNVSKEIGAAILVFYKKDISEVELISKLSESGGLDVGKSFMKAAGADYDQLLSKAQSTLSNVKNMDVANMCLMLVSVYAFAEAYKILSEAMNDAKIQHQERLRIEAECARSMELLTAYHQEINQIVSDYLFEHAETFNCGIAAMDKAIIDGDINSFIRGNTTIQDILKYDVQFRNEEEFDALMDSDDAFRL